MKPIHIILIAFCITLSAGCISSEEQTYDVNVPITSDEPTITDTPTIAVTPPPMKPEPFYPEPCHHGGGIWARARLLCVQGVTDLDTCLEKAEYFCMSKESMKYQWCQTNAC